MSTYTVQAEMSRDPNLTERIAACAAEQGYEGDPVLWARDHQWQICAAPGWREKYQTGKDNGRGAPGYDRDVISDADILAAVQPLLQPTEAA